MNILIISYSHSNQPSVATQQQVRGFQGFGIFPDSRLPPPKIEPQQSLLLGIMSNDSTVFFLDFTENGENIQTKPASGTYDLWVFDEGKGLQTKIGTTKTEI